MFSRTLRITSEMLNGPSSLGKTESALAVWFWRFGCEEFLRLLGACFKSGSHRGAFGSFSRRGCTAGSD